MTNIDIDASELDDAIDNLVALEFNLNREVHNQVADEVDSLQSAIQEKIVEKGLVGDPSDKPGQPPLVASFKNNSSGTSEWTIYSTAEHAMAIEEGAGRHDIEGSAGFVAFEPEDPSEYPPDAFDPDTGLVYLSSVDHPGNEAYHYIAEAQAQWAPIAHISIDNSVEQAIVESGFKPSMGSGDGGLGRGPDLTRGL